MRGCSGQRALIARRVLYTRAGFGGKQLIEQTAMAGQRVFFLLATFAALVAGSTAREEIVEQIGNVNSRCTISPRFITMSLLLDNSWCLSGAIL